jgi:hypothetical protein
MVYYLIETRRRTLYMAWTIGILSLVLLLLAWQTRRVRAARRAAEIANVAKSEFLANMRYC